MEGARLSLEEAHERVVESISDLPAMAKQLSAMIEPVAIAFSEFKKKIDAAAKQALPLISRGDEARVRSLASRLRTAMFRGMRAQMASDFHTHGVDFFTGEPFESSAFDGVVAPVLRAMVSALEVDICAGRPTPGRANFRLATNVSGLFGLHLTVGEIISLPVEDPDVRRMIGAGAIELVEATAQTEERE